MWKLVVKRRCLKRSQAMVEKPNDPNVKNWRAGGYLKRLPKDPWGNDRAGFSAIGKINRKDFGLAWNQLLETGGVAVGDDVKIAIDTELVAKPE